jgi:hypothetical protein
LLGDAESVVAEAAAHDDPPEGPASEREVRGAVALHVHLEDAGLAAPEAQRHRVVVAIAGDDERAALDLGLHAVLYAGLRTRRRLGVRRHGDARECEQRKKEPASHVHV